VSEDEVGHVFDRVFGCLLAAGFAQPFLHHLNRRAVDRHRAFNEDRLKLNWETGLPRLFPPRRQQNVSPVRRRCRPSQNGVVVDLLPTFDALQKLEDGL
jgi:hypothetical protein